MLLIVNVILSYLTGTNLASPVFQGIGYDSIISVCSLKSLQRKSVNREGFMRWQSLTLSGLSLSRIWVIFWRPGQ